MVLDTFNFSDNENVRAFNKDGEAWFVAKDVAEVLGYAKPRNAIAAHCKAALPLGIPTQGGVQEMTIIPESDVYLLISKSRMYSAHGKRELISKFQSKGFLKEVTLHSPPEVEFVELVKPVLEYLGLEYETQKIVGDYRVDLYIPYIKLAVEFDENDHKHYDQAKEKARESFITKSLSCGILRVTDQEDVMISAFRLFKLLPPTPVSIDKTEKQLSEEAEDDLVTKAMYILKCKIDEQKAKKPRISILDAPFVTRIVA